MIRNFVEFIKESEENVYQRGTPFSNGHRSRKNGNGFLESWHYMIDIDALVVDSSNNVVGVIETKSTRPGPGSKLKDILKEETPQKAALLELAKKMSPTGGFHIFVEIKSENRFYWISRPKLGFDYKTIEKGEFLNHLSEKKLRIVSTDNQIFLEFRLSGGLRFKAVDFRVEDNYSNKFLSEQIANRINVPHIEVDDNGHTIDFFLQGKFIGKADNVLFPQSVSQEQRVRIESQWEEIYKKIGIWY